MPIDWTHDTDGDQYPTETGQTRDQIQFHTTRWLIDQGYLHSEFGVIGGQWRGLGLTKRGLDALNSVPDALSGKEPLGKRLVTAVGKESIDTIKQLIPVIIQQAINIS